jgi:hypothetical protein
MKGNKLRQVLIFDQVEASDRHCNNSCQHMSHPQANSHLDSARCDLFDIQLVWNRRRKTHGYIRCTACKKAEDLADEQAELG